MIGQSPELVTKHAGRAAGEQLLVEVPASDSPAIRDPMAFAKDAKELDAARRFLDHPGSDEASRVFRKFGFIVRN